MIINGHGFYLYSRLGGAIYALATAGSPGAQVAPFVYPRSPWLP